MESIWTKRPSREEDMNGLVESSGTQSDKKLVYPCSKYETVAVTLLTEVQRAETLAKVDELFTLFAQIYTVIPALLEIWLE